MPVRFSLVRAASTENPWNIYVNRILVYEFAHDCSLLRTFTFSSTFSMAHTTPSLMRPLSWGSEWSQNLQAIMSSHLFVDRSCCKNRKSLKATTTCHLSVDKCDLPEYCNGTPKCCHTDTYKQDGTPCKEQGYCCQGRGWSLENLCVKIFERGTKVAQKSC